MTAWPAHHVVQVDELFERQVLITQLVRFLHPTQAAVCALLSRHGNLLFTRLQNET